MGPVLQGQGMAIQIVIVIQVAQGILYEGYELFLVGHQHLR
jgi:hypothetical protein